MVFLWIVGIIILLNLLLSVVPVSVELVFDETVRVTVKVGVFSHVLLPKPEKKKKAKKTGKKQNTDKKTEKKTKKEKKFQFTAADIPDALSAVWQSLQKGLTQTGRRMTIDPLTLHITFGGDDPADVAEKYGWASGALWTVMPWLQEKIRIPDPRIRLDVDFNAPKITVRGRLRIRYRVGGLFRIGVAVVHPLLKWFMTFRKKQKSPKAARSSTDSGGKAA